MPVIRNALYLLIGLVCICLNAQEYDDKNESLSFLSVLEKIQTEHKVIFNYERSIFEELRVSPIPDNLTSLEQKIDFLRTQTDLVFRFVSDAIITISKPFKVCGYLIDRMTELALEGATISSRTSNAVSTDEGYFEILVGSAKDTISIRFIGFKTIAQPAGTFNREQCAVIKMIEEELVMNTVLIKSYLVKGIDKEEDWTTSIDYTEFSLLPGLIESDVLQTVQSLPSIISIDETVSNLNIRGGSNDLNLILWDDIRMFQTGHFFGLISSFNPNMTQTARVMLNGTDASLSEGVSGTISMRTEQEVNSEFEGLAGLNFINAELFTNIPIGSKSSLQVAARTSLDDLARTPTYQVYFDRITQDTEIENNEGEVFNTDETFSFYDVSLRWLYQMSPKDLLRLSFIHNSNDLSFDESGNFEEVTRTRESSVSQSSLGLALDYERQWNTGFNTRINLYNSNYQLDAANADVVQEQLFTQENRVTETRLKIENMHNKPSWQLSYGYDFTETEVVNLNQIDEPVFTRRDEEVLREHAVYGQLWYNNLDNGWAARGGIRTNYLEKFDKVIVEPRLSVRKSINDNLQVEVLGEFKHQNISQIINFQNDFLGIEKRRWQLTDNDSIPILRSKQASLGLTYRKNGWLLDGQFYYKNVDGITTQSQSFTTKYEFAREKGSYEALGVELLLRKQINNFSNWLSYSYIYNTYTFDSLEEIDFPSNFDINHSVNLGSTFSNEHWNVSAGFNYRIGKPTSIPVEGDEIVDGDINFDNANNNRIRDYFRLDASALYKFKISKTFRAEAGASIWNITDRANIINNYFRIDEEGDILQFSRVSLGITPNVVYRMYF